MFTLQLFQTPYNINPYLAIVSNSINLYLAIVSNSMPEKPKAESPSTHNTLAPGSCFLI